MALPTRGSVELVSEVTAAIAKAVQKQLPQIHKDIKEKFPEVTPASLVSATSYAMMETIATMVHTTSHAMFPGRSDLGDAIIKTTKDYLDFYSDGVKKRINDIKKTGS